MQVSSFHHIIKIHYIDTNIRRIFYSVLFTGGLKNAAENSGSIPVFPVHSASMLKQKMLKKDLFSFKKQILFISYPLLKDTHAAAGSFNT